MKKTALFLALSVLFLASCTKEKKNPSNNNGSSTQRDINVEYRITSASGDLTVDYTAPNTSGVMITNNTVVNKTYVTIPFSAKSQNVFTINAKNANMSFQSITVDIYVDGQLFQSGSLDHATLTASASGRVQ